MGVYPRSPLSRRPAEFGGGLTLPAGGFCSAHWFDYDQSEIIAQGCYQAGLRLVDVRDPRNIKPYGLTSTKSTYPVKILATLARSPCSSTSDGPTGEVGATLNRMCQQEVNMKMHLAHLRWVLMSVVLAWVLAGCPQGGDGGTGGGY